jgi:hypothetical protein
MYLILAWRTKPSGPKVPQPPMPDDDAKKALSILAKRYKSKSHVMYALQVEPHDKSDGPSWTATLRPLFEDMVKSIRSAVVGPGVGRMMNRRMCHS